MSRFDSVLVANRGEIALRVIRSCRSLGLRTIAVYSDADRAAPHVRAADDALHIGPANAAQSYLSIPALLAAAERGGAGAVHPGYGFLSERADFARAVEDAGLVFIGPPSRVIESMGRKDRAREIAVAAGLPVLPAVDDSSDLAAIGAQVGFPVLVKAAAGGGGKGMRIVASPEELADAVAAARREAAAAFGDDTLLFERYVEHGRHVEVQVVGDEHGSVLHLGERDCSVQRRHQKVLEESPAPTVGAELRAKLSSWAVALARHVGYENAGTVEFLVAGELAYFLEMNTRLQVEHPVTEAVTGVDLVALQLTIAQGEALPFRQDDIGVDGHAIEARVYAEDPAHGFLPQAGTASLVAWPAHARVDAALESGQTVSPHYDPMLGKVIVHAPTREAARRMLVRALDETAIVGLTTNVGFLRALADSPAYADVEIDTAWLDAHPEVASLDVPREAWVLAAWATARDAQVDDASPFGVADGWRLGGPPATVPVELTAFGDTRVVAVSPTAGAVRLDDVELSVVDAGSSPDRLLLEIDGEQAVGRVAVDRHCALVAFHGQTWRFDRPDAFGGGAHVRVSDGTLAAPMPGTMLMVGVEVGDRVAAGDVLGVLEAMKMEIALTAPFDGVVSQVRTTPGAQTNLGATLFVVEPADAPS
jgi:3-methylcrotonyl-CoA carboxylase alpha subunit/acetyl-CoA/propionyl-CoA carboxylase biotin carboxyl carrier protein